MKIDLRTTEVQTDKLTNGSCLSKAITDGNEIVFVELEIATSQQRSGEFRGMQISGFRNFGISDFGESVR